MFLAAAPYFYRRFHSDDWAAAHYQSSILTVSTVTNLGSSFILAKLQKGASYPKRVTISLLINIVVFTLLAFSTILMKDVAVSTYFSFLMVMVFGASLATGINQNGVYAYVSGFGREEYTQAIMGGQGVAGVLPCIVQILSVISVPSKKGKEGQPVPQDSSKSAFAYFITATAVSTFALLAFLSLVKRRSIRILLQGTDDQSDSGVSDSAANKAVSLWTLFKKLRFMASAIFLCFTVTMTFPVFTAEIESVRDGPGRSRLFDQAVFVPLAFFFWNAGDLLGRMLVLVPRFSLVHRPWALFVFSIARAGFIPLYLLCNIRGRGAVIQSDFFYLFVVQILFGVSNGYLGSNCMMGAGQWVSPDEREPAGGFMALMLVGGLTAGSLMSFFVSSA
ncbi:nucleoside transporter family [Aspergillus heteromorphus CBS 117.55]|uniref:Nucleoside transporter family n=1 Tax=Aspergillus heteromorphus CBS 117.55 TaxID=1448321 RepID=A0A317WP28_9EURO|nr:nucleoside transporter family [Aspergillus heteromorphus CBS 117.55]PWY87745.1 nucleoside transporter family [Aspergillus heteromorphus CBS 117.55]